MFAGQEAGNVTREGGVQITPFNMKEEMEEGHFDSEGMYHWKKEEQIKDHWLDNIDWVKARTLRNHLNLRFQLINDISDILKLGLLI